MKNLVFLKNTLIAHRGFHDDVFPENSIAAFKKAVRYGYNIELDVHLTKDNKIVVFHDNNLKRVCGVDKEICECSYDELLKYNLLGTNYKIPLLSEVLKLVDGKVGILIETKVIKYDGDLENNLSKLLDNYKGDFAIQSFNVLSINWFKKHRNNYIRGLLSSDFNKWNISDLRKWIGKTLLSDIILKTDFISYDIKALPNEYVQNKRKNKLVIGWTIKTKEDFEKAKKYCDNIICENMDNFK